MFNGDTITPSLKYYDKPMRSWSRNWDEKSKHGSIRHWLRKIGVEPFCYNTADKKFANAVIFKDRKTKYKIFIYSDRTHTGVRFILAVAPLKGKMERLLFREVVRVIYDREFNKPTRIYTSAWHNMIAKVEELLQ